MSWFPTAISRMLEPSRKTSHSMPHDTGRILSRERSSELCKYVRVSTTIPEPRIDTNTNEACGNGKVRDSPDSKEPTTVGNLVAFSKAPENCKHLRWSFAYLCSLKHFQRDIAFPCFDDTLLNQVNYENEEEINLRTPQF